MKRDMELSTTTATFTAGILGGSMSMQVLNSDSLLITLETIRDLSKEEHTIKNINSVINMIHRLNLKH